MSTLTSAIIPASVNVILLPRLQVIYFWPPRYVGPQHCQLTSHPSPWSQLVFLGPATLTSSYPGPVQLKLQLKGSWSTGTNLPHRSQHWLLSAHSPQVPLQSCPFLTFTLWILMKMCFIHYVKLFCLICRMIYDSNTLGFEFIKFQQKKKKIASRRQSKGEQDIKSGGGSTQQRQLEQQDWRSKQK